MDKKFIDDSYETTWEHEQALSESVFDVGSELKSTGYLKMVLNMMQQDGIGLAGSHMAVVESYPNTYASVMGYAK